MSTSKAANPEQLEDYKLLGKFAQGQSCVLHLAVHRGDEQAQGLRAIKMPLPENVEGGGLAHLLVAEAQLLACIQHPNVVAAHGFGRERGGYVALDYIEGDDFQTLQAFSRTTPDPRIIAAVIADVLQGLEAVHNAVGELGDPLRAVHQAPHARHILVGTDGRARLADFTHARVQRPTSERRRPSRLDAAYRAPEQVLTPDQVDPRTDIFVLGIAFWEALTGQTLFGLGGPQQASQNLLSAPIPAPSLVSGVARNAPLDQVCLRALERDPEARWDSAGEMLAAVLDAALAIGGIALPAEVGRWVGLQAAAQLQMRRGLVSGLAPATPLATPTSQAIPPPNATLGRLHQAELSRPFDRSKTLLGTGLSHERPASTAMGLSPTVLAEAESKPESFRPSRPSSSRPPDKPTPTPVSPNPASFNKTLLLTNDARPAEAIDTDGVIVGTKPEPKRVDSLQERRTRVTQEYIPIEQRPRVASDPPAVLGDRRASPPPEALAPREAAPPVQTAAPQEAKTQDPGTFQVAERPSLPTDARPSAAPASSPGLPESRGDGNSRFRESKSVLAELAWMSIFAVAVVLMGDGLIRLWFGSPYGEPHFAPIQAPRTTADAPR